MLREHYLALRQRIDVTDEKSDQIRDFFASGKRGIIVAVWPIYTVKRVFFFPLTAATQLLFCEFPIDLPTRPLLGLQAELERPPKFARSLWANVISGHRMTFARIDDRQIIRQTA
ncbi:hypothetical protein MFFC18_23920 [Mariniblastus fucicola]|uniref:Uncharacterized protein n=1 Tax=Mariniblastus fucicola TaxID=980251 RepID=A0A5B9PI67_9BACT|nr:hypothetical protein MFFC18_23920 [Mariniblastus fucicola]